MHSDNGGGFVRPESVEHELARWWRDRAAQLEDDGDVNGAEAARANALHYAELAEMRKGREQGAGNREQERAAA